MPGSNTLTPKRLFDSPALTGSPPTGLTFSPNNQWLVYRAPGTDDKERMDLHIIDIDSGESRLWIDARTIADTDNDITELSPEERALRERRRDFSHGVREYFWRPETQDQVLIPIDGIPYLCAVDKDGLKSAKALCAPDSRQAGFQFSAKGTHISFVRDRDLWVLELATGQEHKLTERESDLELFGLPDFLAAEEMHRFKGHWWMADAGLLYCRVDESPVEISYRLEIDATGSNTVAQRYPFAGKTNPIVELYHRDLSEQQANLIWQADDQWVYLARVHSSGDDVVIQVQDRRQQQLSYLHQSVPLTADGWQEIAREESATWVNLSDDLHAQDSVLLMSHEDQGHRRLRRLDTSEGKSQEIAGPTHINEVLGWHQDTLFVSGWQDLPTENHLFEISLVDGQVQQLTSESGWHEITMAEDCQAYVDRFSSPDELLRISVHDSSGSRQLYREDLQNDHPYTPYLSQHAESEYGALKASDGQDLYYRLTAPSEITGQHPVIVYVYGGPGAQVVRRNFGSMMVQLFAQNGFGVLEVDNRGSANRGRTFEAPLYRRMGSVEVEDQVAGLQVLQDKAWVDQQAIGVYGHSYGGYMTLMCLTQASDRFAAGVAVAPVCDWHLYDTHYTERFMDLPQSNPDGYRAGNVLTHLPELKAPLLLMHGMADDNVLFQNSTMIMHELQKLSKPFQLMTYPGAKHSMQEQHVSTHRFDMILSFFTEQLRGRTEV